VPQTTTLPHAPPPPANKSVSIISFSTKICFDHLQPGLDDCQLTNATVSASEGNLIEHLFITGTVSYIVALYYSPMLLHGIVLS
jgi:hypothetical protein